jgi:hypothetical protein
MIFIITPTRNHDHVTNDGRLRQVDAYSSIWTGAMMSDFMMTPYSKPRPLDLRLVLRQVDAYSSIWTGAMMSDFTTTGLTTDASSTKEDRYTQTRPKEDRKMIFTKKSLTPYANYWTNDGRLRQVDVYSSLRQVDVYSSIWTGAMIFINYPYSKPRPRD